MNTTPFALVAVAISGWSYVSGVWCADGAVNRDCRGQGPAGCGVGRHREVAQSLGGQLAGNQSDPRGVRDAPRVYAAGPEIHRYLQARGGQQFRKLPSPRNAVCHEHRGDAAEVLPHRGHDRPVHRRIRHDPIHPHGWTQAQRVAESDLPRRVHRPLGRRYAGSQHRGVEARYDPADRLEADTEGSGAGQPAECRRLGGQSPDSRAFRCMASTVPI